VNLRSFIPFFDPSVQDWSIEARLLRWLTFLWLFVGLVVLFSASYPVADTNFADGLYYFKRQVLWGIVGLVGFTIIVNTPLRYLLGMAHWWVMILLCLILATLVPGLGTTAGGATRWLSIGPIPIQPSELIKPFLVLQSAKVFGHWDRLSWSVRFSWLGVFALMLVGILLQPNLSTTAFCGMTIWLIALAAGLPYLYLGGTAFAGILLATISISLQSYQRRRIMSFTNPWADAMGDGYQLVQSLLAIGSGGGWGSGFGLSQQKLFYLPIQYTDFIFAVFAEEFGFVGSFLLLLLLMTYGTLALIVSMKAQNILHRLVGIGVMILMVGQSLLNIGVATGALPTTGLPLPLFSYGGNSMIASLVAAALLIRVARESSEAEVLSLHDAKAKTQRRRRSRPNEMRN
jgi:cell division protein FtsW